MGRSRRERVVALTKTRKHMVGREPKQAVLEDLRGAVDTYKTIYVFSTSNMRNALLKQLRTSWSDSRFFFGRKKLAQVALGRTEAEEYAQGLQQIVQHLTGNVGLLFTNRARDDVIAFFEEYEQADFARSGFIATEVVELAEGELDMFVPSQVHNLRITGLPVGLRKGKVWLENSFTVCEVGDQLTPEKAKILEFLGIRMAKFRVSLLCYYDKTSSNFEVLREGAA